MVPDDLVVETCLDDQMAGDVSTAILDSIHQAGVRYVFGIPGDAINGLVDAIRRHDHVEFVNVRHEEAGAFAASAIAKLTGGLAVVAGTAGPGAIHLLNGLYDAKLDGAAVLAITGQVETPLIGIRSHQEIDLEALFDDVAVFSETIVDPSQVPRIVHMAIREAVSRRGVSHLVMPAEMALKEVGEWQDNLLLPKPPDIVPDEDAIASAVALLDGIEAVTLLVGIGAIGAVPQVLELADRINAPIVKTLRAKELIADDHPLVIGGLGLLGTEPAVAAMERTDLLFMIGTDFPYMDFYPEGARCIQLDIDPTHIARRNPVDVALVGDAASTLSALVPKLSNAEDTSHLEKARSDMEHWLEAIGKAETDDSVPIRPQRLARSVGEHSPPGTIFTCDTGAVTAWAARHLRMKQGDRFVLSSSLASMGFAVPAAIGAQLTYPDRRVVALVGDGGFMMLLGDLRTAVTLELPITIVVFNNSRLGLIQMEQESEGLPDYATALDNPDFAEVAEAMGARGWRVNDVSELDDALEEAMRHPRPSVVDVVVNSEEIIMPPRIEPRMVFGYAKAKLREIVGGQAEGMSGVRSTVRQVVEHLRS